MRTILCASLTMRVEVLNITKNENIVYIIQLFTKYCNLVLGVGEEGNICHELRYSYISIATGKA